MTLRTKANASRATLAVLAVVWAASAAPAHARWTFHDESLGEAVVAPAGGTRANTCEERLRAVSGAAQTVDVEGGDDPATIPIPEWALTSVDYQVWKAPAGFDTFNPVDEDPDTGQPIFEDADGTRHPATLVGAATTPPREPLATPRPVDGELGVNDDYVFTTAPISIALTGVRAGDLLGLAPTGETGSIFVDVRAIDCDLPVLDARVDLLPASPDNIVRPHIATERLPVRVFGSRRLLVRHITGVRLGEAAPNAARAPRDVDGDGRADRVYVFQQGETIQGGKYIQCIDTSVRVTGRTSDRVRFQARSPIETAGCAG